MNYSYFAKICLVISLVVHCGSAHGVVRVKMHQQDEHYGLKCALKLAGCGVSLVAMGLSTYSAYLKQRQHKKNLSSYAVEAVAFVAGALGLGLLGKSCRRVNNRDDYLQDLEKMVWKDALKTLMGDQQ